MALHTMLNHTKLCYLWRYPQFRGLALKSRCGTGDDSQPPAPCPPCKPKPRPPCRARPGARARALRVTCCPPPIGLRPPCSPRCSAPPLTCERALESQTLIRKDNNRRINECITSESTVSHATEKYSGGCDSERDHVARRLALAEQARRLDYEREVVKQDKLLDNKELPSLTTLHRLSGERECAQATDGRQYAIICPPTSKKEQRCGPDRIPPPPRCVELIPDGDCQIRNKQHLDPCAHRPRILLEVERSTDTSKISKLPAKQSSSSLPTKKLSSRIMESLNFKRTTRTCCAKSECKAECNKSSNNTYWCKNQPKPVSIPPPCREPTLADRLRSRGSPSCNNKKGTDNKRRMHTSAKSAANCSKGAISNESYIISFAAQVKSDSEKLNVMLQHRELLKEAGQGRVVREIECNNKSKCPHTFAGFLDIPIPTGTNTVQVHVSLLKNWTSETNIHVNRKEALCKSMNVPCSHNKSTTAVGKCDSWLSIKSIQKKLAGCKKINNSKEQPPCPSKKPTKLPINPHPPCAPQTDTQKEQCPPRHPKSSHPCKNPQETKRFSSANHDHHSNTGFIRY